MGSDTQLLFYENLRPVKCMKVRYHNDRLLSDRVRRAPIVPVLALRSSAQTAGEVDPLPVAAGEVGGSMVAGEPERGEREHVPAPPRKPRRAGSPLRKRPSPGAPAGPARSGLDPELERLASEFLNQTRGSVTD